MAELQVPAAGLEFPALCVSWRAVAGFPFESGTDTKLPAKPHNGSW